MFPGMQLRSVGKLLEQWRFRRPALLFFISKWSRSVQLLQQLKEDVRLALAFVNVLKIRARADDLLLKDLGAQHWMGGDGWSFVLSDTAENLRIYQYFP